MTLSSDIMHEAAASWWTFGTHSPLTTLLPRCCSSSPPRLGGGVSSLFSSKFASRFSIVLSSLIFSGVWRRRERHASSPAVCMVWLALGGGHIVRVWRNRHGNRGKRKRRRHDDGLDFGGSWGFCCVFSFSLACSAEVRFLIFFCDAVEK